MNENALAASFLKKKILNMALARLVGVCGLFLAVTIFDYRLGIPLSGPLLTLLSLSLIYSLGIYFFELLLTYSDRFWPRALAGIRVIIDVCLITAGIYLSGYSYSALALLYFITIIGHAIATGSLASTLTVSLITIIVYTATFLLAYYGLVPPQSPYFPPQSTLSALVQISFFGIGLSIFAIIITGITLGLIKTEKTAVAAERFLTEVETDLRSKAEELQKMNQFMSGRETDRLALQQQANALLRELGRPARDQS
ncbi:MAG: hypothetical protein MUC35_00490 [Candidatus Margulisbacteria bacterium]|nr:hypothetical protein [Candidatus Margulisiibacteriota bacterium]